MTKKQCIRILAILLALLMPIVTVFTTTANAESTGTINNIKYDSPDINSLMGAGEEPEDISVSAGAQYLQKPWYEYVVYSDNAVCSYRINDYNRLLFYDPYTYTNSMIMDVKFDATTTEFDTMSTYSVSHTKSKTITAGLSSTYTDTTAVQSSGRDITYSKVKNRGENKTKYDHQAATGYSGTIRVDNDGTIVVDDDSWTVSEAITFGAGAGLGIAQFESETTVATNFGEVTTTYNNGSTTSYSDDYGTTTSYTGEDTVTFNNDSTTDGWTELSNRITKTVGSSCSTNDSWSETESVTVTKTYAATHFASDGVTPLPWAIVHYTVQMPTKCCLQYKYEGEWITVSTTYCLLTTVQGTCRAWIQNGQVYYEDWGSGEPVVATDFWSQFMTRDQLMNAYEDKLYPAGGED